MKIAFLDTKTVGNVPNLNKLDNYGEVTLYETTSLQQRFERLKDVEVVISNKVLIDREVIEKFPSLKLICIAATGKNNVDLIAAEEKGIAVKNVVGYSTHSVAQTAFSMIFYLLNHTRYYDQYVKKGRYAESSIFTHMGPAFWQIYGKRFGIIGLGTIGKRVGEIAKAFGAEVIFYSTSGKNANPDYLKVELDELLQTSDIVSIHAPLNDKTLGLIGYEQIKKMKKSAILINTGRGGIINEAELAKALDEDLIAGAALDVLRKEPINADNALLQINNKDKLLILPHIAWASIEARIELIDGICRNIEEFVKENES